MSPRYTLSQLAERVGGTLRGDAGDAVIDAVADVCEAGPGDAAWVSNSRYARMLSSCRAGVVLVSSDIPSTPLPTILCEHIERSVAKLLGAFAPPEARPAVGIDPTARIHETAELGPNSTVGPHVVVQEGVRIGADCVLHAGVFVGRGTTVGGGCTLWPHVVVRDGCVVGNRVTIHANSVIGSDGFGFYFDEGRYHRVPHIGGVTLGDDVEIGACTCIDRSKTGQTVVGRGTKIDNQVQIAHNVRIGEHCVLAAQVGISGSARTGDYCVFGGKSGLVDNITLGSNVQLAGGVTVATKDIPDGSTVSGFPARNHRGALREQAGLRRIPDIAAKVKNLLARVAELESSADHRS